MTKLGPIFDRRATADPVSALQHRVFTADDNGIALRMAQTYADNLKTNGHVSFGEIVHLVAEPTDAGHTRNYARMAKKATHGILLVDGVSAKNVATLGHVLADTIRRDTAIVVIAGAKKQTDDFLQQAPAALRTIPKTHTPGKREPGFHF